MRLLVLLFAAPILAVVAGACLMVFFERLMVLDRSFWIGQAVAGLAVVAMFGWDCLMDRRRPQRQRGRKPAAGCGGGGVFASNERD